MAVVFACMVTAGNLLAQGAPAAGPAEIEFWNTVKDSQSADEIEAYLQQFPDGVFAKLARIRIKALEAKAAGSGPVVQPKAPPPKAQPSAPSQAAFVLTEPVIKEVQQRLYDMNFNIASVSGQLNGETIDAIRLWQKQHAFNPDGQLTEVQVLKMRGQRPPKIWGALAYAANGTVEITWSEPSRTDAEGKALVACQKKSSMPCKVVAATGNQCAAAASFREPNGQQVISGTFAARLLGLGNAQIVALANCNKEPRSRGRCEIIAKVCPDGSHRPTVIPPQQKRPPKGEVPS